jgi:predicted ATPase
LDEGPELIDRLVPGLPLLARAYSAAHREVTRLEAWLKRTAAGAGGANVQQVDLFEQCSRVLHTLARRHPLLLVVDDLQWADAGSISLLFHLGRRLAGYKILIVGAYRPGDGAGARWRTSSSPIVNTGNGDMRVDLTQAEGRRLVDAYLDTEPNQLGAAFRETLYRHTGGHPLFTIELLRGLQERGDLTRDEAGRWIEGPALDWATLPPRVEAVIAERISRLPKDWQATLAVASVEGEEFTAEAVARVVACDEQEIIQRLSGPLSRQYRLIAAQGLQRLGPFGQRLSRYRFRHYLFQKYLYGHFDEVERAHQHEAMGTRWRHCTVSGLRNRRAVGAALRSRRHRGKGDGLSASGRK